KTASHENPMSDRFRLVRRLIPVALVLSLVVAAPGQKAEKGVPVGKHATAAGLLLAREGTGKPWQVVKQGGDVTSGETYVGVPGAAIDSKNNAVRLVFLTDLDGTSPFPVLEAAVVPEPSIANDDLTFTLDRGRVEVMNRKDKGAAKVRVHFRK